MGAGALVQWLKLPAGKVGDRGLEPHTGLQVSKKQIDVEPWKVSILNHNVQRQAKIVKC